MSHPPPASTAGKAENVAKEGSIRFRILAIEEEVRARDAGNHVRKFSKRRNSR
jgi:hypothetical protein